MVDVETLPAAAPANRLNVTDRLATFARTMPDVNAIACPFRRSSNGRKPHRGTSGALYNTISFGELEAEVERIAKGLAAWGVPKGTRLALLVKPGIEFVTLVFALLRAGMVIVLVDPGMGRRNLIRCLGDAEPEGFVAIGSAQVARLVMRNRFQQARWNVTIGHRWFWGGKTLNQLRIEGSKQERMMLPVTSADETAAIIFTSGSTGPPKGVLYTHRMFDTQVEEIQSTYVIEPGGIDLACFPLFALFNAAMGVTTLLPEMDFSRPATADPKKLLAAANDWQVTQAFASPAVWRVLSDYCRRWEKRIESLQQVFSCGAPVSASVLHATLKYVAGKAKLHTPYGATECLPVATIEAVEILNETSTRTSRGAGVCVGRKFASIDWQIIRISDEPIEKISEAEELSAGQIGELIVRGPQVSPCYATRTEANAGSKILDGNTFWHRTGDVGYLDENGRFWYCGRKSQRVESPRGTLFTERVEAIFNTNPFVFRTALVGIGPRGNQLPVIVYEPEHLHSITSGPGGPHAPQQAYQRIPSQLREIAAMHELTNEITTFLSRRTLPVDVRHNAKVNREQLTTWASKRLDSANPHSPTKSH